MVFIFHSHVGRLAFYTSSLVYGFPFPCLRPMSAWGLQCDQPGLHPATAAAREGFGNPSLPKRNNISHNYKIMILIRWNKKQNSVLCFIFYCHVGPLISLNFINQNETNKQTNKQTNKHSNTPKNKNVFETK